MSVATLTLAPLAPSDDVVATCRRLLGEAESGALRAVVVGGVLVGGQTLELTAWASGVSWSEIMGCAAIAQASATEGWRAAVAAEAAS